MYNFTFGLFAFVFCSSVLGNEIILSDKVKVVIFVPEEDAEKVRKAMGTAGAGSLGNYYFCSISSKAVAHFTPLASAHPAIGTVGEECTALEERIEAIVHRDRLGPVIKAVKQVHPYEEVVFDIFPLYEYVEK